MTRPKLLDLFCCEGGASMGYHRAGFNVVGVDLFEDYTQSRYPFPSIRGDAIEAIGRSAGFDAYHASPPCQRHTAGTRARDRSAYPDLIAPTREALSATGKPYIIENVPGSPLHNPVLLCGSMFGLTASDTNGEKVRLERHRLFESNIPLRAPGCPDHDKTVRVAGSYGGARSNPDEARNVRHGGYVPPWASGVQQALMGIDWMTQRGCHQAIPPAYTEFLGAQLLAHLYREAVA